MEHAPGKGNFTLAPIEGSKRSKWTGEDFEGKIEGGATFLDVWLAEHPANKTESEMTALSVSKVASQATDSSFLQGFESEARAIQEGIAKYGSLEAFEHATRNVDYFADGANTERVLPVSIPRAPSGGYFQSHLGSSGVHQTPIHAKPRREYEVSDRKLDEIETRVDDPQSAFRIQAKRPDLKKDFDF